MLRESGPDQDVKTWRWSEEAAPDQRMPTAPRGERANIPEPRTLRSDVASSEGFEGIIGLEWVDITPPVGVRMKNWHGDYQEVATGVHQTLRATCLTFQKKPSDTPMVLFSLDLGRWASIEFEAQFRARLQTALDLPKPKLILHTTDTASGPSLDADEITLPGGFEAMIFMEKLAGQLVDLAKKTLSEATWALLEWTSSTCDLAAQRDILVPIQKGHLQNTWAIGADPSVPADRTVLVGRITGKDRRWRGTIVNYACHATSLGWQNSLLSPDYIGSARNVVEATTAATCLFLQGFCGDLAPTYGHSEDLERAEANGRQLGYAVLSALAGMPPPGERIVRSSFVDMKQPVEVQASYSVALSPDLTAAVVTAEVEWQTLLARFDLTKLKQALSRLSGEERQRAEIRIHSLELTIQNVNALHTEGLDLWVWRVGSGFFIGGPIFAYSLLQGKLRRAMHPIPLVCMNSVNGFYGYLVSDQVPHQAPLKYSPFRDKAFDQVYQAFRAGIKNI